MARANQNREQDTDPLKRFGLAPLQAFVRTGSIFPAAGEPSYDDSENDLDTFDAQKLLDDCYFYEYQF